MKIELGQDAQRTFQMKICRWLWWVPSSCVGDSLTMLLIFQQAAK